MRNTKNQCLEVPVLSASKNYPPSKTVYVTFSWERVFFLSTEGTIVTKILMSWNLEKFRNLESDKKHFWYLRSNVETAITRDSN